MPIDKVVVNASPLIVLAKTGYAALLPKLFSSVFVPESVADEIYVADDAASRLIAASTWIEKIAVEVRPEIAGWNLGEGESAVLSFALESPDVRASLDDLAARRCAKVFSIRTIGTIGILLLAKRRALLDSARTAIEEVRDAGLYVSDELIDMFLKEEASK
ncbi:MAG: DUF3368 domain-containing protein [Pyrinomonadaceae bacterium]